MHRLETLVTSAILMLVGLGGTILLSGGWQAAAALLAMTAGILCVLTYIALIAGADRPRRAAPTPRGLQERVAPKPTTAAIQRSSIRRMPVMVKSHG
jgi:hypothetical protein